MLSNNKTSDEDHQNAVYNNQQEKKTASSEKWREKKLKNINTKVKWWKKKKFPPTSSRETRKKSRLAVKYDVCVCFCLARFFFFNEYETRWAEETDLHFISTSPVWISKFGNSAAHTIQRERKFEFFIISDGCCLVDRIKLRKLYQKAWKWSSLQRVNQQVFPRAIRQVRACTKVG